jgi:ribonuclease HI
MAQQPIMIQSIYTDGGCSGNPGPGGWGVVVYFSDGAIAELGGSDPQTTNNRMELQGAIAALRLWQRSGQHSPATLYTDSEYVQKGITQWVNGWQKRGWTTAAGKPVQNQDLWQELLSLKQASPPLEWKTVPAHRGVAGNEAADAIASAFAQGKNPSLRCDIPADFVTIWSEISGNPVTGLSDSPEPLTIRYNDKQTNLFEMQSTMSDVNSGTLDDQYLPRETRMLRLDHLIETLRIAEEVAEKGYLISSSELADLMDVNASAVTSRGDHWSWRNWVISRVRREGNQILWQLERVD